MVGVRRTRLNRKTVDRLIAPRPLQPKGSRKMAESITTLTNETFDEVIGSAELPVVVDFWG